MNITISLFLALLLTLFAEMLTQSEHACAVPRGASPLLVASGFLRGCFFMSLKLFKSFRSFKSSLDNRHRGPVDQTFDIKFVLGNSSSSCCYLVDSSFLRLRTSTLSVFVR